MKKILIIIAVLVSAVSYSQTPPGYTLINSRYDWLAGLFKALGLPAGSGPAAFTTGQAQRAGAVYMDTLGSDKGLYVYLDGIWQLVGGGSSQSQQTVLISGGSVFQEGPDSFNFGVASAFYLINGVPYTSDSVSFVIDSAHATLDRRDLFYLDATGAHVREGTPSEAPLVPQTSGDEIALTSVSIDAGTTAPTLSSIIVYDENTESVVTNFGTTTNGASTNSIFRGTVAAEFTNIINGEYGEFTKTSGTWDIAGVDAVTLFVDLKAQMPTLANLRISLWNGTSQVSGEVILGINKNSTVYQGISIPISAFGNITNTLIDKVRIRYTSNNANNYTGFFLDYIHFIDGLSQPGQGGNFSVTLNLPSPFSLSNPTIQNGGVWNPTFSGNASQYVRGDGTLAVFDAIRKIGNINTYPKVTNGLRVSADTLYGQTADTTNNGFLSDFDWRRFDSTARQTAENVGDGDSIMVNLDAFRTAFKTLKISGGTFTVTDTTIQINVAGGGVTASQGVSLTGSDVRLGTDVGGTGVPFTYHKWVELNRKRLFITNQHVADSSEERHSYLTFISQDSVKTTNPDYDLVPKAFLNVKRQIIYDGGYQLRNRYGNRSALEYIMQDSMTASSDGGDYGSAQFNNLLFTSRPGYTGRSILRGGHVTIYNVPYEHVSATLSKVHFNTTTDAGNDNTNMIHRGYLGAHMSYLSMGTSKADTIDKFIMYNMSAFMGTNARVNKMYGLRNSFNGVTKFDSLYFIYDSVATGSRSFLGNSLVVGAGAWSSPYAFRNNGATYLNDSTVLNTATLLADTSNLTANYDFILRRKSTGGLVRVNAGLLGFGGGGGGGRFAFSGEDDTGAENREFTWTMENNTFELTAIDGGAGNSANFRFQTDGNVVLETANVFGGASYTIGGASMVFNSDIGAYAITNLLDYSDTTHMKVMVWDSLHGNIASVPYSVIGGGGSSTFAGLSDGPGAYSGNSGKAIRVKATEDGLEYFSPSGGGDMFKVGTPSNHQWGVWTGDGTMKGVSVTANRAIASDANGDPVAATTTATELGYVNGVTSAIQTQIDSKLGHTTTNETITATNESGTGNVPVEFNILVRSDETLSNSSADQNLFTNTAHDVITVQANTTYEFTFEGDFTHGATSHSIAFGLTPTTATVTNIAYNSRVWTTAVGTTTATDNKTRVKTTATTAINLAGANAQESVELKGWITIGNTGGTLTPQIKFSADPTGTILLKAGAKFTIKAIGNDTFTQNGPIN